MFPTFASADDVFSAEDVEGIEIESVVGEKDTHPDGTFLLWPKTKGMSGAFVISKVATKSGAWLCERIPDLELMPHVTFELANGKQVCAIEGEPGTKVRVIQFVGSGDSNEIIRKLVTLPGLPRPPPEPVDPVKPVDPDKPDPPKPGKYDVVHIVILEDPRSTTPKQDQIFRELRLSQAQQYMRIYDAITGQDETGRQSSVVQGYISKVESGKKLPYWFVVGVNSNGRGVIVKSGEVESTAEIVDEWRQARKTSASSPEASSSGDVVW